MFRMSNFLRIGRSVRELRHFFEIQDGGRPSSWIINSANVEVSFRTEVIFCFGVCQIS
jgi:hypothetical protein